ncbi:MAG: hypothetical protein LBK06_04280 [Planctomycetaceae bacterium]|jgi:hypothetical protein|nr:hypothetical protein [Planctomycetaceae bacterium]
MERKEKYNVLKEIRKIRKRRYEETKDMTRAERAEYYRKLTDKCVMHMKELDPSYEIKWAVKD